MIYEIWIILGSSIDDVYHCCSCSLFTAHSCWLHAKEPKFAFWCKVSLTNTLKVFLPWRIWIEYFHILFPLNGGVMDIIPVFHTGDRDSILHWGVFILFFFFYPIFTHFGGFSNPQKGVTLLSYTYGTFSIQSEF